MSMIPVLVAAVVTVIAGWLLIKRFQTHMVLLFAGMIILAVCICCGMTNILPKGTKGTGLILFDLFELMNSITKKQIAGVGLIIMACGGFAGYMSQIGASNALVKLCAEPLRKLSSPYVVLAVAYLIGQTINLAVVSAAGLVMLLLVAFYPILTKVGVSKASAAACIVCCCGIAAGPMFGTEQLAAKTAGLNPVDYWVLWQLKAVIPAYIVIAISLMVTQKYFDNKNDDVYEESQEVKNTLDRPCPLWYAAFPFVPIILLFIFSPMAAKYLGMPNYKLGTVTALYLTWFFVVIIELIRLRDVKLVFGDAVVMWKKMAGMFGGIVALIICAEIFAQGLKVSGFVNEIIAGAKSLGLGVNGMTGVLSALVGIVTGITGSGVGAFSAFASLSKDVQAALGGNLAGMLVPMHLASSVFRSCSPVAGCVIAAAVCAGISPMAICRRTVIPLCLGFATILVSNFIFNM